MAQSVYAEALGKAMKSLHAKFPVVMEFEPLSVRLAEDLRLGRRYGYLGPPTAMLSADPVYGDNRRYSKARGTFEGQAFLFPLIVARAYATELETFTGVPVEQLNLFNSVAVLNKEIDCDGVYLKPMAIAGDLNVLYQQSVKSPNPWIVRITGEVILPISIYKSPDYGEHQLPPGVGEWIQQS